MRIRPAILTAALLCATFALPAPALAGDPIPDAIYKDRPRGEVKTIEINVSSDGKQIDILGVRLEEPCGLVHIVPSLFYVKIHGDGSFKRKLKSAGGNELGDRAVLKARGKFSGDGRTVSGRWSYTDVGYTHASADCRAVARFKARTDAKPVDTGDARVGPWSGTTEESLPVEFDLFDYKGEARLEMRDVHFQVNVVCQDDAGNQTAELYEGQLDRGRVNRDDSFEAVDDFGRFEVTGQLGRDTATGRIKVTAAARLDPLRYCSTPNPEGVAFTAGPG